MTRPLRSGPITGPSPLLRTGPPARHLAVPYGPRPPVTTDPQEDTAPSHVPYRERQAGLTSPPCRTPPGQSACTRQTHPGTRNTAPVLMPSVLLTTRQQRFACARLPDPHLTPLTTPFPRSLTTTVFSQRSTRRFEASPRRATPKGLPSSPVQHHFRNSSYMEAPSMFVTHAPERSASSPVTCGFVPA